LINILIYIFITFCYLFCQSTV